MAGISAHAQITWQSSYENGILGEIAAEAQALGTFVKGAKTLLLYSGTERKRK